MPRQLQKHNLSGWTFVLPASLGLLCFVLLPFALAVILSFTNLRLGYAFARLQWPGRDGVLLAVIALMIIPLEAIAVPLFYEVTLLGWRNTYLVQIVPFIANAFSIYLFLYLFPGITQRI